MGEIETLMGPSWPIIIKMAEAMFKREHPNAEWSPGRASPIWFARAEEALPIVTAACAEVARDLTQRQSRGELCGDIATAIERLGDGPSPVRR